MFEGVDIEVGRAVEGGEEVADAGDVVQPSRPRYLGTLITLSEYYRSSWG